eukprot:7342897-Pyramimonas_sp.AAC.1
MFNVVVMLSAVLMLLLAVMLLAAPARLLVVVDALIIRSITAVSLFSALLATTLERLGINGALASRLQSSPGSRSASPMPGEGEGVQHGEGAADSRPIKRG